MKLNEKQKKMISEFLRYIIVGGISFLVDAGTRIIFRNFIFPGNESTPIIVISTSLGYIVGFIVNYILSLLIVFNSKAQQKKGKSARAVLITMLIAAIAFGLTNLLQLLGEKVVLDKLIIPLIPALTSIVTDYGHIAVTVVVAGIVLIWNYLGRKIFVFKEN